MTGKLLKTAFNPIQSINLHLDVDIFDCVKYYIVMFGFFAFFAYILFYTGLHAVLYLMLSIAYIMFDCFFLIVSLFIVQFYYFIIYRFSIIKRTK